MTAELTNSGAKTIFIETFKVHNFQCKLSQTNEQMRIRWDAESILKGNLLANIHLLMAMVDHYTRAGELWPHTLGPKDLSQKPN